MSKLNVKLLEEWANKDEILTVCAGCGQKVSSLSLIHI